MILIDFPQAGGGVVSVDMDRIVAVETDRDRARLQVDGASGPIKVYCSHLEALTIIRDAMERIHEAQQVAELRRQAGIPEHPQDGQ